MRHRKLTKRALALSALWGGNPVAVKAGLRDCPPSRVTTVYLTQPLFGVALSFVVLGEPIGPELYLGGLLVVIGSYFVQRHA